MSNTKTIAKNTGWYSIENMVSVIVTVITSIAIARTLGPTETGYLVFVTYIASVVANLGGFGIPSATRKYMAEFLGMGDRATARLIFFRTFWLQIGLASVATLGIVLWALHDTNNQYKVASLLIVLSIWPSMVNSVPAQANSATEDLATNLPGSVSAAVVYFFAILGTVVFHWGVDGVGAALLLMRSVDFLVRLVPTGARILSWDKAATLPAGVRHRMVSYAWQSVATMLLAMIVWERCEVLLLKYLCADIRQVAFYSIAYSAGMYLLLSATVFGYATGTTIFAQFGRDKSKLPQITATSFRYLVLTSVPLHFIATGIAVPALLLFYGKQYVGARYVVLIAPLLCLPKAFLAPIQNLLQSMERQKYVIGATVLAGIVDIGVASALIPAHGAVGACIGSGMAQITAVTIMWAIGMRIADIKLPWAFTAKIAAASAAAALCAYLVAAPLPPIAGLLAGGASSLAVLAAALYVLRALEPEDHARLAILTRMLPRPLAGPFDTLLVALIHPARREPARRELSGLRIEPGLSMAAPSGCAAPSIPTNQPMRIGVVQPEHDGVESEPAEQESIKTVHDKDSTYSGDRESMGRWVAIAGFQDSFSNLIKKPVPYPKQRLNWLIDHLRMQTIRIDACLRGGDCGASTRVMSRVRGDLLYGSRHISEWPHVKLIREYEQIGAQMWKPGVFEQTDYYKNAAANIEVFGSYFDALAPSQIHWGARRYLSSCFPEDKAALLDSIPEPQPEPPEHIAVHPILHSSCYQVFEGHHRLAALYAKGVEKVSAVILKPPVRTPLQEMLLDTLWLKGRRELYQPIHAPEVSTWTVIRRCTDRAAMIKEFLSREELMPPSSQNYLDVACSYGWFVREMGNLGLRAEGVEGDPIALSVGKLMYGLRDEQLHRSDAVTFLSSNRRVFDVVSCFSLVHHFLLRRRNATAEDVLRLLDGATRRVLFFDMGEEHEYDNLKGWNPAYIQNWLQKNTSFSRIVPLGKDQDAVPPNQNAFGRTLFACVR